MLVFACWLFFVEWTSYIEALQSTKNSQSVMSFTGCMFCCPDYKVLDPAVLH